MKNTQVFKKVKYLIIVLFTTLFAFKSYGNINRVASMDKHNYEVVYISSGEGTETIKIYSFEKNQSKGIKQCKINALRAILFKGIPNAVTSKPLITEFDAEEKYKKYFNDFFKKDGKYLKFISLSSNPSDITKEGNKLKVGIILTIQKDNLRKELEASNIIKSLNNGF